MYRRGGESHVPPSLKKDLENRYRFEMHVYGPIFQGQLIEKKIKSINCIIWVIERVEKNAKKG